MLFPQFPTLTPHPLLVPLLLYFCVDLAKFPSSVLTLGLQRGLCALHPRHPTPPPATKLDGNVVGPVDILKRKAPGVKFSRVLYFKPIYS